jgi:RHS repeat-associated protein
VDTGLNYAVNRYYNSAISRFISQDPVFLALGNEGQIKQLANQDQTQLLSDPQLLNSYAYARNNPLRYTDPDGLLFKEAWHGTKNAWNNSVVWVGNKAEGAYQNNATARWLLDHPESGLYVSIGASLAAEALTVAAVAGISTIGTRCLANCSQFGQESGAIVSRGWGNPKSLNQHYSDHGGDFGSKSANDYANKASNFFNEAPKNGYQQIVGKDGTIRIYDGKTNTFGSYNTDGSTKTFFKPSGGQSYWNTQTSDPQKNVKLK